MGQSVDPLRVYHGCSFPAGILGQIIRPMLVGGFTTVAIASVVIAGIFVKLL